MRRGRAFFTLTSLMGTFALISGCTQAPVEKADRFYVPSTLIVQSSQPTPISYSPLAFQVLPGANAENFFVPRGEKVVYGSFPVQEISAYSIWIYDNQPISLPGGSGNRYTWAVKEGILFP
jgi:hypothetical protein